MLKPGDTFFAASGDLRPGGSSTWHIVDWDERRWIAVTIEGEVEDPDLAIEHLERYADEIAPTTVRLWFSPQGELTSTSAHSKDDHTICPFYPSLESLLCPDNVAIITRSDLEELDRLGPETDLVRCLTDTGPGRQLVFKYFFIDQTLRSLWLELNISMRLPRHANVVPFDRIVVDELDGRLVGFTNVFIPGGNLEDNPNRVFKLKWLHQLCDVIDDLNLKFGISHQDVAPRNLLVDPIEDCLLLFDFNFSARFGKDYYIEARNDIKGVFFTMYEIITRDDTLRAVGHDLQDLSDIEEKTWVPHPDVRLDHPVGHFRHALIQWRERRQKGTQITFYRDAPQFIDWPDEPEPEECYDDEDDIEAVLQEQSEGTKQELEYHKMSISGGCDKVELPSEGKPILKWQRPAQARLKPGDRLLATGELIDRVSNSG